MNRDFQNIIKQMEPLLKKLQWFRLLVGDGPC